MYTDDNYNPLFELVYEEEQCREGALTECKEFLNKGDGFKFFHMNICSLRAKHNELEILFESLNCDFDCIILTEAHINAELMNIHQYSFHGYTPYCTVHNTRKTDGVAVYIKSDLEHSVEEIKIRDANCLFVKIKKDKKVYSCTSIFRSPSGKVDEFLINLENILSTKRSEDGLKILTGDINLDLLNKKSPKVQSYLNLLCEHGFIALINKPTRVKTKGQKKSKTCLDHIFAGPQVDNSFKTFILHSTTSDHYSTIFKIEMSTERKPETIKYITSSKINEDELLKKNSSRKME